MSTKNSLAISDEAVDRIGSLLSDRRAPLKKRFRALFTLKHLGGRRSIDWISRNFEDESALLKHELAYCLGQMGDSYAAPALRSVLEDREQEPMVRHEAGECRFWFLRWIKELQRGEVVMQCKAPCWCRHRE